MKCCVASSSETGDDFGSYSAEADFDRAFSDSVALSFCLGNYVRGPFSYAFPWSPYAR
jgi:hypothetical protein